MSKVNVLGVNIDRVSFNQAEAKALELASGKGNYITTVNSEFVIEARKNAHFKEILNASSLAIPDSWGVVWASEIFGEAAPGRVSGVDLMQRLLRRASEENLSIGLLGAWEDTAQKAKNKLLEQYTNLKIVLATAGNPSESADNDMRKELQKAGRIDLLFVAYGAPKQEEWIARNIKYINVGVAMGVGGAIDYIAGVHKRAPQTMLFGGRLEWFWRLITQPRRAWRMTALPRFAILVWLQKFNIIKV